MACFDTDKLILRHYPSNLICNKSTSRVAPATLVASKKSFVHCWKKEVSPRQPCECQPISAASSSRSGLVYPRQLTPPLFAYQNQTLSGIGSRICRQLDVNHFYQLLVLVIGVPSRRRSSTVRQRPRFYLGYVLALLKKKKKKRKPSQPEIRSPWTISPIEYHPESSSRTILVENASTVCLPLAQDRGIEGDVERPWKHVSWS